MSKKPRFETIKTFNSSLGGWQFKVTSNGETVKYHQMGPRASTFNAVATESYESFFAFADEVGLFDPYNDNPAVIVRRIEDLAFENMHKPMKPVRQPFRYPVKLVREDKSQSFVIYDSMSEGIRK